MDLFDLNDHVSVVTGGNRSIGLGMARGIAGAGVGVAIRRVRYSANPHMKNALISSKLRMSAP